MEKVDMRKSPDVAIGSLWAPLLQVIIYHKSNFNAIKNHPGLTPAKIGSVGWLDKGDDNPKGIITRKFIFS